jgi:WhiB family transcriptional regulator, redox-sensing transcriptional regulator
MTDWDQAACNGQDTGIFFDHEDTRGEKRAASLAVARAVCATCVIRTPCRDYAVHTVQAFGVWGGLTAAERSELIVANQRRELLTPAHRLAAS